jgi:molecular chaperone GrpE
MKQDDDKNNKENVNLDSVPFPDEKDHGKHCHCHENKGDDPCTCGDEACTCSDAGCECASTKGEPSEATSAEADTQAGILARIDAITAENAALRDMLLRTTADFDNFRKRNAREKDEIRKTASAHLVSELVPVLDTMALATSSARKHHPEASGILDGIDMIVTQFKGVLKANGVEEIAPVPGADFDPNLHESIAKQPSDTVAEGKISVVTRTGYILNGRLIRAASVVLSSGKAK